MLAVQVVGSEERRRTLTPLALRERYSALNEPGMGKTRAAGSPPQHAAPLSPSSPQVEEQGGGAERGGVGVGGCGWTMEGRSGAGGQEPVNAAPLALPLPLLPPSSPGGRVLVVAWVGVGWVAREGSLI